jgi:branched-chain amino acid transport system substrate-binding protein
MKERNKVFCITFAAALVMSLLLGSFTLTQASDKMVKIGAIMPISGPMSVVGISFIRAYESFFETVNEQGGLKVGDTTYKFEVIGEDSKANPESTTTAARKLVYKDKVKYVFGAILSANAAAIYQVCGPAKVGHVISWIDVVPDHPGDVSANKPLAVRPVISSDSPYEMDYKYLKENYPDAKRLVLVFPDLGYDKMIARAKALAAQYDLEVVGLVPWEDSTPEFASVYTKALAYKPDAIHSMLTALAGTQLKNARELGFKGPFFTDTPLGPEVILMQAGPEASYDVFCNGMHMKSPTPKMKEIMDFWQKKYEEPMMSLSITGWNEAWVLFQAMKKASSVEPDKVMAAFDQMTAPGSLKTLYGDARMGGKKRFGTDRVLIEPIPISRLVNGKIEFVSFKMPVVDVD